MLTESLSLGGQADFINYGLYLGHEDFLNFLTKTLTRENSLLVEKTALSRYPSFYELSRDKRDQITTELKKELLTNEYEYAHRTKLYTQASAGEVDINHLYRLNSVHEIITIHNDLAKYPFLGTRNLVPESTCYSIDIYPTFQDYYTRVLKK